MLRWSPWLSLVLSLAGCAGAPPDGAPLGAATAKADLDRDGFEPPADCNDLNNRVYPGAPDVPYDGRDADCAGDDDFDADGDGARARPYGGDDCDDRDPDLTAPWVGDDCAAPYGACDAPRDRLVLVPGDAADPAAGLALAASGDQLCIGPGTWDANLDLAGKAVELVGATGAEATILDGGGRAGVVRIASGEPDGVVIRGLTLRGGDRRDGGALYVTYTADTGVTVRLEDVLLTDNHAADDGGAIYAYNASVELTRVTAWGNDANDSGGALRVVYGDVTLTDTQLLDNVAGGSGGALLVREGDATLNGVEVAGNQAGDSGGGLDLYYASGALTDVWVTDNSAGVDGGGIKTVGDRRMDLTRVVVRGNVAGGDGGGLAIGDPAGSRWNALVVADNVAGGHGGGAAIDTACELVTANATVVGNAGACGGAVAVLGACATSAEAPRFASSLFAFNEGSSSGGLCVRSGGRLRLGYSAVWENGVNWEGMSTQVGSRGNVAVDPGFVSFSPSLPSDRWSLLLGPASPVRDAGDVASRDPDGSRADMGAWGGASSTGWFADYDDADGDGLYDGWEVAFGLDPARATGRADPDDDGLDNAAELAAGTWPDTADTDGDGVDDGDEVAAGTDPLAPG